MAKLGPGSRDAAAAAAGGDGDGDGDGGGGGGGGSGGRGHVGDSKRHMEKTARTMREEGSRRREWDSIERVMREGTKQDNGGRGQVYRGDLDANERTVRGIVRYKTRLH